MNRNLAFAMAVACVAAGPAFADDITVDPNPFVSTLSQAQVREELRQFRRSGVNPWADEYDQLAQFRSTRTRGEVTAEFVASRNVVAAFMGEDSGSDYLAHAAAARGQRAAPSVARAD